MLLWDAGGGDDGSATRRTCSSALSSLADSDPKARSALHTRKGVRSTVHIKPRPRESATLRSLSERLTLVTAVTSTLLPWLQNSEVPPISAFIYLFYY